MSSAPLSRLRYCPSRSYHHEPKELTSLPKCNGGQTQQMGADVAVQVTLSSRVAGSARRVLGATHSFTNGSASERGEHARGKAKRGHKSSNQTSIKAPSQVLRLSPSQVLATASGSVTRDEMTWSIRSLYL